MADLSEMLQAFMNPETGGAMPLGLALMRSGFRSPYEKPRGFGNELTDAVGQWQQMKTNATLNKMNQEKLEAYKREAEKAKRTEGLSEQLAKLPQQFIKPAVPGALDQGQIGPNLPIQSQQGQMLAEQMGSGGTIADLLAMNQSANYAQQGTPQEMPLQGQPASMDYKGLMQAAGPIQAQLDPQGYFKGLQGQAEQARKAQEWEQYIQNLPPEIKNNQAAMAVLGGGPELAGKLGPGVLPSVLKPKENKPLEGEQGRAKFKIFPDMTPEQAKAVGARYVPGVGGIALGEKDKPISISTGDKKPLQITDSQGNVRLYDNRGNLVKDLGGVGKASASTEKIKGAKIKLTGQLNEAITNLEEATKDGGLIDQSTGSGAGALVDMAAGFVGKATPGSIAVGRMKPIFDLVLKMVPRFEGPQSDKDTQSYKEAAGELANPAVPNERKKAAAKEILRLMKARKGQFITNDMEGTEADNSSWSDL